MAGLCSVSLALLRNQHQLTFQCIMGCVVSKTPSGDEVRWEMKSLVDQVSVRAVSHKSGLLVYSRDVCVCVCMSEWAYIGALGRRDKRRGGGGGAGGL